jgi:hypothetical protein
MVASEVEIQEDSGTEVPSSSIVRLVLDREHEGLLREWSTTAQDRLLVCSHRLGPIAEVRLVPAGDRPTTGRLFRVRYEQQDLDVPSLGRVSALVSRGGGTIQRVDGLHAKVVVSDVSSCISSYNFLSADPFGTAVRTREIGVVVESPMVADRLWEVLTG